MASSRLFAASSKLAICSVLVLAAASAMAQGRFTVSADGQEVLDTSTRLSWKRCAEGMKWDGQTCTGKAARFSFAGAKKAAGAAGSPAWRVPSREELTAIVDRSTKKKPRIDATAFPKTPAAPFWALRRGSDDDLNAWLVSFANGRVVGNTGQAKFPLRLVRASS